MKAAIVIDGDTARMYPNVYSDEYNVISTVALRHAETNASPTIPYGR